MPISAFFFGSIGSIAETSDVQRRAYNTALAEAGLSWEWDRDTYADLLAQAGGRERLAQLSAATGAKLTDRQIEAIHQRKTDVACAELAEKGVKLRPGVAEMLRLAKERGLKTGLVTTTYMQNIDAILDGAEDALGPDMFDIIVSRTDVQRGKPSPEAYKVALRALGVAADAALAVEDTAASVMSAKRAGIATIATPGDLSADQDFWQADLVVPSLLAENGELDPRVLALFR